MDEQRNAYKGTPPRPWIRVTLVAVDGTTRDLDVLADTGNPCALIVATALMQQFQLLTAPGVSTNLGQLAGCWLRIQIPEIGLDKYILAYGSDGVAGAVAASHQGFEGLAGLPLLQMMEYGGDRDEFWIRISREQSILQNDVACVGAPVGVSPRNAPVAHAPGSPNRMATGKV